MSNDSGQLAPSETPQPIGYIIASKHEGWPYTPLVSEHRHIYPDRAQAELDAAQRRKKDEKDREDGVLLTPRSWLVLAVGEV